MPSSTVEPKSKPSSPFSPLNIVVALILVAGGLFYIKPTAESPETTAQPLFTLSGTDYSSAELPLKFGQPFYQTEVESHRNKQRIVSAAAIDAYIKQQMLKENESQEVVVKRLFDPKPPSNAQIEAYYQQNQARIKAPLEQVRNRIGTFLITQEQQQKQSQLVAKLINLKELKIHLSAPQAPFAQIDTKGYPSQGKNDAEVTLVEFADYQCPHCKSAHAVMKELLKPYLERIRYVYMDFPINRSGISRSVAEGAVCADQQGKFWQYHDLAFAGQEHLSSDSARQFAGELQLDLALFDECRQSPNTAEKVKHSEQQAIKTGVTGTPSFFLNGHKLVLKDFRKDMVQQIEDALAIKPL